MSWLYTLVFAGLMFSSNPSPVSTVQNSPKGTLLVTAANGADETEHFEQITASHISRTGISSRVSLNLTTDYFPVGRIGVLTNAEEEWNVPYVM